MSNNIYEWEFDDSKNRWPLWYVIALSIVLWLSIWWFFTKQYWMSFLVLLISWLVYFVENNSTDNIKVEISDLWIKIAWWFYNFSTINWFSIIYKSESPFLLRLHLTKKWLKTLDLNIEWQNISEIKTSLSNFIDELPRSEITFWEKIIQLLKL